MRLINADALLVKQANIAKTFARSDAQKSLMGRVMYNTQQAPTIDAIPVEWLTEQIRPYTGDVSDIGKSTRNGTIKDLIRKWQKEQEAK